MLYTSTVYVLHLNYNKSFKITKMLISSFKFNKNVIKCIMEISKIDKTILKFNNSSHSQLSFLSSLLQS